MQNSYTLLCLGLWWAKGELDLVLISGDLQNNSQLYNNSSNLMDIHLNPDEHLKLRKMEM